MAKMTIVSVSKREVEQFKKDLVNLVSDFCGCGIQYGTCTCNTCFFSAMEAAGIDDQTATWLWHAVLVLRGDYKSKDIIAHDEACDARGG
jgi:hypothetical protein